MSGKKYKDSGITTKIPKLIYVHCAVIRDVLRNRRHQMWKDFVCKYVEYNTPEQLQKAFQGFCDVDNACTELGVINQILEQIDLYEESIQQDLKLKKT